MRKCQMFAMASVLSDAPRTKEKRILRNKPSSFQQQKGNWNLSLSLSQGCGTLKMPAIASRFCSVDVRFSGPRRRQLKAKSEEMEPDSASSGSRPSDRSIFLFFFSTRRNQRKTTGAMNRILAMFDSVLFFRFVDVSFSFFLKFLFRRRSICGLRSRAKQTHTQKTNQKISNQLTMSPHTM